MRILETATHDSLMMRLTLFFLLALAGAAGAQNPVVYCTAKPSSAGCANMITVIDPLVQPVSGAANYRVLGMQVQEGKIGLLFGSPLGAAALPFNGGTLCVQPPIKRGPIQTCSGDNALECDGMIMTTVNDGNLWPSGLDVGAGNSGWYQYYYRDPANGPGYFGTALTNAIQLDFQ